MNDASSILQFMDRDRLWGREKIAAELLDAYHHGQTVFGIESVKGDGKSEFLFQFSRALQNGRGPDAIILRGGVDRTEGELIASLYKSLTEIPCALDQRLDGAAEKFVSKLPTRLRRLAGAMMKDIAKAATLGAAEKTIEQIADMASGKDGEPDPFDDLLAEESANKRRLIARALDFVSDLGKPLCVVIEDYELLDATAESFLRTLVRSKPTSCVLVIATNVEEPCTSDWQKTMKPSIELVPGLVLAMPEISRAELCEWFEDVIGKKPTAAELERLVESSNGGRAVYVSWVLDAWRKGRDDPLIPDIGEVVIRRKRDGMCDDARFVGDLLSLLPGNAAVPIELLGPALASQNFDLQKAVDDASPRGLLKQVDDRVRFGHSSYAAPWLSGIDANKRAMLRKVWYDALVEIGFFPNVAKAAGMIPLLAQDIVDGLESEEVDSLAAQLEASGSKEDSLLLHQLSYRGDGPEMKGGGKT
ncbi:hypothetical protein T8S45_09490 [Blastomonas marina]|uniref:hypothetical protein n=1 Tax=Blastomonas marina TaxID=1867408 RepID=UPI002AC993C5|nr:hypothetical protein [Blastomonas marina]WPZ03074.1 hypothetical protein T8S45_09490 [Blastomonas marina]